MLRSNRGERDSRALMPEFDRALVDDGGESLAKWDQKYLPIEKPWRRNWTRLIPFFDYPLKIRKAEQDMEQRSDFRTRIIRCSQLSKFTVMVS